MKSLRVVIALLIAAASLQAIQATVVRPYRCAQRKKLAQVVIDQAYRRGESMPSAIVARQHLDEITRCIQESPEDVDLWMNKAALLRLVGLDSEAIKAYEQALRYDRRPEIYLNLGIVQAQQGDKPAAIESYARAVLYSPGLTRALDDPEMRKAVLARAAEIAPASAAALARVGRPIPNQYRGRNRGMDEEENDESADPAGRAERRPRRADRP